MSGIRSPLLSVVLLVHLHNRIFLACSMPLGGSHHDESMKEMVPASRFRSRLIPRAAPWFEGIDERGGGGGVVGLTGRKVDDEPDRSVEDEDDLVPLVAGGSLPLMMHPLVAIRGSMTRRSPLQNHDTASQFLGLGKKPASDEARYTPFVSVGALSNVRQFFDDLRANIDSMESTRNNQLDHQEDSPIHLPPEPIGYPEVESSPKYYEGGGHRLSHNLRSFVAMGEPGEVRRTNSYDPSWLWTGLGR